MNQLPSTLIYINVNEAKAQGALDALRQAKCVRTLIGLGRAKRHLDQSINSIGLSMAIYGALGLKIIGPLEKAIKPISLKGQMANWGHEEHK